jgi:hypothetical protein
MAFVLALSVGNHLMAFLAAPALFVLFLLVKPRVLLNWKLYLWSLFFAVLGLSVNLFLPLRAGLKPVINEANPTCPNLSGALGSILSFGKAGCANLAASLAREQYAKPPVSDRLAPFWAQLLNYLQYFDWQWARSLDGVHGYFAPARLPFTLLFAALGLYGAYRHFQKDRTSFYYVLTLFLTLSVALIFYLNFKYGFGQAQAWGRPMESAAVRERDYFFLVSFSIWGLWAGVGITALWLGVAEAAGGVTRKHLWRGSPVLVLAFVPLLLNWSYASRAGDYAARDWAYNLLMSVEPYGVLFTNGDNDTFPLWYLQEVEGIRKDVTVLVWSYLNTPWYVKQMRELTTPCETPGAAERDPTRNLCQRVYHAPPGADVYANAHYPTKSILPYTDAQIDQITGVGYIKLGQNVTFEDRGIRTEYPAGTVLPAANQFILAIIKQAWGDRPIYFASTTNAHRQLGLAKYTPRQGVAFKLMTPDELKQPGIVAMSPQDPYTAIYGDYVDVPRTQKLISEVFRYRDLVHRPHWVDDATRGIPTYYGYAYMALAQARQQLGTAQKLVQQDVDRAEAWLALSNR